MGKIFGTYVLKGEVLNCLIDFDLGKKFVLVCLSSLNELQYGICLVFWIWFEKDQICNAIAIVVSIVGMSKIGY